ncbi:unnamed protein product [Mycena citricolor]|uniref:CCHC-type domain-containing protein n=1 Tax=Mycena citricolor TaxID=2018698 RepID=A0AAD2GWJ4_9AGAR|nr:unnamed protein product [Mycena citricolor]
MADTVTYNAFRITPLSGPENYGPWKVQMGDIITEMDLNDHINPEVTPPTDTAKKAVWDKADRRTLSSIRLRVAPNIVQHIQGETTALGAWQMLSALFELKGQMGLILARHKFYSTRALDQQPLEPHIKMMRQLQGELRSLGQEVSDSDFAVTLLSSLPTEWDSFIRANLHGTINPQSKTVIADILTEERRRYEKDGLTPEELAIAMAATHNRRSVTRQSRQPASNFATSSSTWKRAICHRCGGKGHIARVCPSSKIEDVNEPDKAHAVFGVYEEEENDSDNDYAL